MSWLSTMTSKHQLLVSIDGHTSIIISGSDGQSHCNEAIRCDVF